MTTVQKIKEIEDEMVSNTAVFRTLTDSTGAPGEE
jgi:hypothetical protein